MSFKFNFFPADNDDDVTTTLDEAPKAKKARIEEKVTIARPFREVTVSDIVSGWNEDEVFSIEEVMTSSQQQPIRFVQLLNPAEKLIAEFSDAKARNSDLISGVYEGGMKIWEGSLDLMTYICPDDVRGKQVIELGCGFGLPGLLAHQYGAESVHFQDYNESVLLKVTGPSALLQSLPTSSDGSHFTDHLSRIDHVTNFRFFAGDWSNIAAVAKERYDVILTAETIYEVSNYPKLHEVMKKLVKKTGVVIVASKSFYFGVGGGVHSWIDYVTQQRHFDVIKKKTIEDHLQRHILVMRVRDCEAT